jgi:hypothetical protein
LDGIPKHLPALLRAEKLLKKARRAKLLPSANKTLSKNRPLALRQKVSRKVIAQNLFALVEYAQGRGWSAEDLLRSETHRRERDLRKRERHVPGRQV